jgi:alkanesulfonate monooxygenase SsuD/methylene tetrahydromethanopterin reductase-like flavin-dependent oxidoreductase (luciferase family)
MSVAVARNLHVAESTADLAEARTRLAQTHAEMIALSRRPDDGAARSHILACPEAVSIGLENALYGTPEAIAPQLMALRAAGAQYLLLNLGRGAPRTLHRFARELMPGFLSRTPPLSVAEPAIPRE